MAYDRIIRLRGSTAFEPAAKASIGYELDPDYNHGFALVIRSYLVAEDYSLDEFAALIKTEAEKEAEVKHFRATFMIDSRNLPPPEEGKSQPSDAKSTGTEAEKTADNQ